MRTQWLKLFRLVLIASLLLGLAQGAATQDIGQRPAPSLIRTLTIMGDSWGHLLLDPIKDELQARGYDDIVVLQTSIPGSTARQWAENEFGALDVVKQIIALDPNPPLVYVSLGGNDFIQRYQSQGDQVFAEIDADLHTIAAELTGVRSDVHIILAGYDILKFDRSDFCLLFAYTLFGSIFPWDVNPLFLRLGDIQAGLAADFPQVTYAHAWGALQGSPGSPDTLSWSPGYYFPSSQEDCVHLNAWGYDVYTDAVFDLVDLSIARLLVTKAVNTAGPAYPGLADSLRYDITVHNAGDAAATATVVDDFPLALLDSISCSGPGAGDLATGPVAVDIPAETAYTWTCTATVGAGACPNGYGQPGLPITNSATAAAPQDPAGPATSNTVTTTVYCPLNGAASPHGDDFP